MSDTGIPFFLGQDMTTYQRTGLLEAHRALLARWRKKMNLVGPGSLDIHYDDAHRALAAVPPATGRWADLGTGAGFPGVIFAALHPDASIELVDSRVKRCVFLEEVVDRAGATGIDVRNMRIEDLEDGVYDGIMARALAAPAEVVALARRLLRPVDGRVILFLQAHAETPAHDGFRVEHEVSYEVDGKARRSVVLRRDPTG